MNWLFKIITILLFVFFIINGTGVLYSHLNIRIYYLLLPGLLYFYLLLRKKPINFPFYLSLIFLLFLFLNLVSAVFFSVNKQTSFLSVLFQLTLFLTFIFFYNLPRLAERIAFFTIVGGGIFFSLAYFFWPWPVITDYQLIRPIFQAHNHLGDFLGLFLILVLILFNRSGKKAWLVLLITTIPLFVISFSRSAYLALFLTVGLVSLSIKSPFKKRILILIGISLLFIFFSTVKQVDKVPIFGNVHRFFSKSFDIKNKDFFSRRLGYFDQAIKSIRENPGFGVGPGNFSYLSKKQAKNSQFFSESSHNIFIEAIAVSGIPAGLLFLTIIFLILIVGFKKKDPIFYLFLYLFFNFQTDYIYQIDSILVLFFILASIFYREKKNFSSTSLFGIVILLGPIFLWLGITSNLFLSHGYLDLAVIFNTINNKALQKAIVKAKNQGDEYKAMDLAQKYERITRTDLPGIEFLANFYQESGQSLRALNLYQQTYKDNRFLSLYYIKKNYFLILKVKGKQQATEFLTGVLVDYNDNFRSYSDLFNKEVVDFCHQTEEPVCQWLGWW